MKKRKTSRRAAPQRRPPLKGILLALAIGLLSHLNDDATRGSRPISYAELVKRTGMEFLPGVSPGN